MVAAVFFGALALFAAVIVGSTLHAWYGIWGIVAIAAIAYAIWLITVRSLQQQRNGMQSLARDVATRRFERGSTDIVPRGSSSPAEWTDWREP